ncbi:zeta toxin family protein [Taibaiella koreensis]|uniref:zeta toxin family protein n=1 Tax=Taibaiella koreensis TaxID=1268548 RepID=UPI000E59EB41|nr:zeta toxin family protein [Taibaiella koreensis]
MRVFAGPNGSGKSTIFRMIEEHYDVGHYINPDEIEKELSATQRYNIGPFGLTDCSEKEFSSFSQNHSIRNKASKDGYTIDLRFDPHTNYIYNLNTGANSYEASLLSDFLRQKLVREGKKLSFETVMSHSSKLEILDFAKRNGYKVYLYFICTESHELNIDRVKQRVEQGGHDVSESKIKERYYKTLQQLRAAVSRTYRAFLWDNSTTEAKLILSIEQGTEVTVEHDWIPNWIADYLL